ncbi:hypothetical protein ILUMI_11765 [Ignelater luminosus]|uniref:Uncharacterized protein n=1 Tax=Ignelater luminosus TaxID=2038154 RepID=A0A8K0D0U4_IGNLU|nr:hypothetical protein ILUMI_11765 [Ignelater luminosus]
MGLTNAELRAALKESKSEEEPLLLLMETNKYIPEPAGIKSEESDVGKKPVIEQDEECDLDESNKEEPALTQPALFVVSRNVMCQKGGAAVFSSLFSAKETFKSIMSNEICDIILRETNQKGRKITEDCNNKLVQKHKASKRPPPKVFKSFTEEKLDTFSGILLAAGACNALNAYPLQSQVYTGKPSDGKYQVNVGERTVLDLLLSIKVLEEMPQQTISLQVVNLLVTRSHGI